MSETKVVVKPQEIEAIPLDKFLCLVDNVLASLDDSKKEAITEEPVNEVLESASTLLENDGTNGLVSLDIIGGSVGPMMILNLDTKTNKYVKVFSNAAIAATSVSLNPTTIRQRCKDNKIVDNIQWSYITAEEYETLKG
jgi:hypothetical protein